MSPTGDCTSGCLSVSSAGPVPARVRIILGSREACPLGEAVLLGEAACELICDADADGRNRRLGGATPARLRFARAVISSPLDEGPADTKRGSVVGGLPAQVVPFVDMCTAGGVVSALPLRCRTREFI